MKKIKTVSAVAFLLLAAVSIKAQDIKVKEILVHKDGGVVYQADLSVSDSIKFSKISVADMPEGVEINGIVWATSNVDAPGVLAANPWETGMLYQWNRPTGWSSGDPMVNHEGGTTWYNSPASGATWDVANNVCPSGWRVPTRSELQNLMESGHFWGTLNGVNGRFFGNGEYKVFLPAVSIRNGYLGTLVPGVGRYWSGTSVDDWQTSSYQLGFHGTFFQVAAFSNQYGCSVRCVLSE